MEKRVVITGMGAITPIGTDVFETWEGIKNKKCGVNEITLFDTATFKTKLDAEIKNKVGKYFKIFNKNTKNLANRGLARF